MSLTTGTLLSSLKEFPITTYRSYYKSHGEDNITVSSAPQSPKHEATVEFANKSVESPTSESINIPYPKNGSTNKSSNYFAAVDNVPYLLRRRIELDSFGDLCYNEKSPLSKSKSFGGSKNPPANEKRVLFCSLVYLPRVDNLDYRDDSLECLPTEFVIDRGMHGIRSLEQLGSSKNGNLNLASPNCAPKVNSKSVHSTDILCKPSPMQIVDIPLAEKIHPIFESFDTPEGNSLISSEGEKTPPSHLELSSISRYIDDDDSTTLKLPPYPNSSFEPEELPFDPEIKSKSSSSSTEEKKNLVFGNPLITTNPLSVLSRISEISCSEYCSSSNVRSSSDILRRINERMGDIKTSECAPLGTVTSDLGDSSATLNDLEEIVEEEVSDLEKDYEDVSDQNNIVRAFQVGRAQDCFFENNDSS